MTPPYRTLAICGPTASGKSALSLKLARDLSAEVVNVDSVQVYRELDIGSAKLSQSERGVIPHHALDLFSPDETANVADFRSAALSAIHDLSIRGKLPILVGGSGMYFTVLLHGLADVPATPEEIRAEVSLLSPQAQYDELLRADPVTAARLNPNDRQRVSRALEIFRVSGKTAAEFFAEHRFGSADVSSLVLVLCCPRDELYRRIDRRSEQMLTQGLITETKGVIERYGRLPILETLGYKQASAYLDGQLGKDKVSEEIALHTRRFAKRQMTYWRNEPKKRGWFVRPREDERAEEVQGFAAAPVRARSSMKGFRAFRFTYGELLAAVKGRLEQPLDKTEVWYIAAPVEGQ